MEEAVLHDCGPHPPKFNTNATVNKVERTSVGLYANPE